MKTTLEGQELIHRFESCQLRAYLCPAGKLTIGYGNTFYENGAAVKAGDVITERRAVKLFDNILSGFEAKVNRLVTAEVTANQFSALVSFAYNCGVANLQASTLLRKVNANPDDKAIRGEFLKWNKARNKSGKLVVLNGLTRRRQAEADLYFS